MRPGHGKSSTPVRVAVVAMKVMVAVEEESVTTQGHWGGHRAVCARGHRQFGMSHVVFREGLGPQRALLPRLGGELDRYQEWGRTGMRGQGAVGTVLFQKVHNYTSNLACDVTFAMPAHRPASA
jgi:hypothetical protein